MRWVKAAAASASVSYRTVLPESELVRAVKTGQVAPEFLAHVTTFLEEGSQTLLLRVLSEIYPEGTPEIAWKNLEGLGLKRPLSTNKP